MEGLELYPFQAEGVGWLTDKAAANRYLADEMGLGKSVQALAAAERIGLGSLGVVCPAATIPNWEEEALRWAPSVRVEPISYASPQLPHVQGKTFDRVVLDEAHYCKSPKAKRTENAHRVAQESGGAWLLSGTPIPNHIGELWTTFDSFWPELIPDGVTREYLWLKQFTKFQHTRYGIKVWGNKNAATMLEMLKQMMLRRTLDDIAEELPELRVDLHTLPPFTGWKLNREDMALLLRMEREEALDQGSMSRIRRLLGTLKVDQVARVIADELEEEQYQQIVVLYHHRDVGDRARKLLEKFGLVQLDGKTPKQDRKGILERFKSGEARVFLGQQTSSGTGLNLQSAHELALLEPSWVPDENRQAIKRIHRFGQGHPCRARVFAVQDTLDHAINRTLIRKSTMKKELRL